MKIYDYQKFGKVYIGGSVLNNEESLISAISHRLSSAISSEVHPKEIERQERLKKRRKLSSHGKSFSRKGDGSFNDSIIIFSGSTGFGTKSFEHFDEIFKKLNEILEKNNTHVLFIRGNNDDPLYFTGDKINYSNIKAIEDYSLIKLDGFNCLCVGGGISLDRKWKQTQEKRIKKSLYWEGEATKFNLEELKSILEDNTIACVITHESPSFIGNDTSSYSNSKWASEDKDVITDAINERVIMDKIYTEIVKTNKKPYVWAFTGNSVCLHLNNIRFLSVTSLSNIFSLNDTVEGAFGFRLGNNEVSLDNKAFSKYLKKAPENFRYQVPEDEEIDNLLLDGDAEMDGEMEIPEDRAQGEGMEVPHPRFINAINYARPEHGQVMQEATIQPVDYIDRIGEARPYVAGNYNFDELMDRMNAVNAAVNAAEARMTTDDGEGHG
jgi:hypothetical protein